MTTQAASTTKPGFLTNLVSISDYLAAKCAGRTVTSRLGVAAVSEALKPQTAPATIHSLEVERQALWLLDLWRKQFPLLPASSVAHSAQKLAAHLPGHESWREAAERFLALARRGMICGHRRRPPRSAA